MDHQYCSGVTTALRKSRSCFFFASRRRHTRCLSDWSSDVCSSDLINQDEVERQAAEALRFFGDGQGENPYAIHEELRSAMQSLVGIVRTEEDLKQRSEERRVGNECTARSTPCASTRNTRNRVQRHA